MIGPHGAYMPSGREGPERPSGDSEAEEEG
jgi:hypothetical protein